MKCLARDHSTESGSRILVREGQVERRCWHRQALLQSAWGWAVLTTGPGLSPLASQGKAEAGPPLLQKTALPSRSQLNSCHITLFERPICPSSSFLLYIFLLLRCIEIFLELFRGKQKG